MYIVLYATKSYNAPFKLAIITKLYNFVIYIAVTIIVINDRVDLCEPKDLASNYLYVLSPIVLAYVIIFFIQQYLGNFASAL